MFFSLLAPRTRRPLTAKSPLRFRPQLDGFEDRVVPAAPVDLSPALAAAPTLASQVIPITIDAVKVVDGALTAVGHIGNTAFSVPLDLSNASGSTAATPILSLHLDAIHLSLLGLNVDTSNICLNITAQSGSGNLLGNLLSDVSHLLDNGSTLSDILGGLTSSQLTTLTNGLTGLLNGALSAVTAPGNIAGVSGASAAASGAASPAAGATNILHLSLGPVDLTLLGLNVHLDNCAGGPVTVDITAQSGPGNLLGNLLGNLSHLLDSNAATNALNNAINRVVSEIDHLANL